MTPIQRALIRTHIRALSRATFVAFLAALLAAPASLHAQSFASTPAAAPTPAATPAFDVADVHVSAHTLTPYFTGGSLRLDRYTLHNATMVDMISLAYGVDSIYILSGPAWLDTDRFDVAAHAPRGTSPDDIKLMFQALLAERFHLVLHKDTHPLPTYVLRVAPGGAKMKQADDGEPSKIDEHHTPTDLPAGVTGYYSITCHNQTMAQFSDAIRYYAGLYNLVHVVDATGLTAGYDFDLHWTSKPSPDGLSIFDAVDKQLGLKLTHEQYPSPVLIVDKVDEKPTPNAPGLDKALPPAPPAEFDVVVLTPSKPETRLGMDSSANQIKATGVPVNLMIAFAWALNPNDDDLIANAPKWLSQDRWDLIAKAAPEAQTIGPDGKPQFDYDMLPHMVQTMLAERFQMKVHMEDRPIDAFTLVAAGPKMQKADPVNRTGCKEGPGPDGKDPRIANPILGRLIHCENMTMAQLADQLPTLAGGYIFTPVKDGTGLTDAYDFTLSFSGAGQLKSAPPPSTANAAAGTASDAADPNGALSLGDAMAKQLGVKLVKEKRPSPVLVIDHIEEKPTDN
jgi:uncharacterized protein (TIGR03435 family)